MAALPTPDELLIEVLVARAAKGDEEAWHRLWSLVEPRLDDELARPSYLRRLGQRDRDRDRLRAEVKARLRDRLRHYQDAQRDHPRLRFLSFLRVVAKRVGLEYQRGGS